jgi:hypothetical protein
MVDVVELRNAATILRQWASEIRRDSVPAPYATASEDISLLEKVSDLLEQAADEVLRLERRRQNNADTRQLFVSQNWRASCLE